MAQIILAFRDDSQFIVSNNAYCQAFNQSTVPGSQRNSSICEHYSKECFVDVLFPCKAKEIGDVCVQATKINACLFYFSSEALVTYM